MRYQEERKILIAAGYTDLSALEAEFYGDSLKIKQQFDNLQTVSTIKAKGRSVKGGLDIQKKGDLDSIKIQKQTSKVSTEITEMEQQAKLAVISSALGSIAAAVGENTVAGKALAIAQATIDTYAGATLALKTYPPPFGGIAAGVVIAAGLLNVKKIISTKVPKPPGTNLKGAGGGGGGAPSAPQTQIPQIQTANAIGGDTGSQIAETIAESSNRPVQAYVVSTEVSSTQALDRRTNSAASFG